MRNRLYIALGDDRYIRPGFGEWLKSLGHKVHIAADGVTRVDQGGVDDNCESGIIWDRLTSAYWVELGRPETY